MSGNMYFDLSNSISGTLSSPDMPVLDRLSNENSKLSTTLSRVVLDQLNPCECLLSIPFSALAYGRSGCFRLSFALLLLRRVRSGVVGGEPDTLFVKGSYTAFLELVRWLNASDKIGGLRCCGEE